MKILTVSEAGEMREIELSGVIVVTEGHVLDRLTDENGQDFYFTKTGLFDGTGHANCGEGTAESLWRRLEEGRVDE